MINFLFIMYSIILFLPFADIVYADEDNSRAHTDKVSINSEDEIKKVTTNKDKKIEKNVPTLNFDAASNTGKMLHGSTGFLYGVSEIDIPSANLIEAIQPKMLIQKAADGKQHPSGDGYRLNSYLQNQGIKTNQIYLQDYYLEWPYESNGIEDYQEKVKTVVSKMLKNQSDQEVEQYSFVIFNEPDQIWYSGNNEKMCQDWSIIYQTIKTIHPKAKIAGPNYAKYNQKAYKAFFEYASKHHCLPDYITWHELQKDKLLSYKTHYNEAQKLIKQYYTDKNLKEPIIFINETVNFEDVGAPGPLVNWLSIFEETKTYASLPYWGLANSLNELAANTNEPNSAWWIYKWYNEMHGHTINMTQENIEKPGNFGALYGLTSIDEENQTIKTLFGGQAGKQQIKINNLQELPAFNTAEKVHVKIYQTHYTGHHGFADEIPVIFEGNIDLIGNQLNFSIEDAQLMDAFFAIITPESKIKKTKHASWRRTYEAEDATMIGQAKRFDKLDGSDLARSNRAEVGNINTKNDGVEYTVDVPQNGHYRLDSFYSVQAPQVDPLTLQYVESGGQNRAIGAVLKHKLFIDGKEKESLLYDSTVKWGYYNYKTVYVNLTKGLHKIKLMHDGKDQSGKEQGSVLAATLDKMDLSLVSENKNTIHVSAEELTSADSDFFFDNSYDYTSGSGYAKGKGKLDFYVNVPKDGYYELKLAASGGAATIYKKEMIYAKDAKAESKVEFEWLPISKFEVPKDQRLTKVNANSVYLAAGVNHLELRTNEELAIDYFDFHWKEKHTAKKEITIQAEEVYLQKNAENKDSYPYLPGSTATPQIIETPYASNGKAIEGFQGGKNNSLSFNVKVENEGAYILSIFYANNEPAPVMKNHNDQNYIHPYNTDLVERYAQISVNNQTPQTIYFRNTLSWDVYKNRIIKVNLKKGNNKITLSNDNSYKFSSIQDDFTPRFDKFVLAPLVYKH
ncbi:hypothetical protein MPTP_0450 [Melissococcus plutonius ATCC 35311]|uniref:CBM6 domain-containing protein n=3 Tax=Melissococcus plutonius TaxID=33970 RepID=F3Y8V1_MELPT|nr:hypothetical protein [Melissococcus plutonius]BAK20929.1 hypothetical protein MPTP_0450 [Melissococcus plutonius ATCC 35311]